MKYFILWTLYSIFVGLDFGKWQHSLEAGAFMYLAFLGLFLLVHYMKE